MVVVERCVSYRSRRRTLRSEQQAKSKESKRTLFLEGVDALENAAHALQRLPGLAQGKSQAIPKRVHGGAGG